MHKPDRHGTQAKRNLQRAEECLEHYHMLFENYGDGSVMVDNMWRFVRASRAYCTMPGYTLDKLRRTEGFCTITPEKLLDRERSENGNIQRM